VHVTDSRHCAGKAAHDHTLAVDTHINFSIEDYRKKLKWKISVSMALKAPECILFNMSPGPPVGTPHSVRAPLESIKGRAHTIRTETHKSYRHSEAFSPKLSQAFFDLTSNTTHKWT
jgi:hypothetical protein